MCDCICWNDVKISKIYCAFMNYECVLPIYTLKVTLNLKKYVTLK